MSLAFVRGIHRWPVNSPYKGLVTRKMFPFDNVIMDMIWGINDINSVRPDNACFMEQKVDY